MKITKDINFNSERLLKNEPFTINYSGNLFNQGSDEVFIKFGYGESWDNITELQMNKLDSGFSVEITPTEVNDFNFCFRNNNNVWDNNSYQNYSMPIEEKQEEIQQQVEQKVETSPIVNDDVNNIENILEAKIEPIANETKQENVEEISTPSECTERKSFNIDAIIDEILNTEIVTPTPVQEQPVSYFEEHKVEKVTPNENPVHVNKTSLLVEDVLVPFYADESNGQFLPVDTKSYSKFFTFRRKLKLALYRILHTIPKLITGNYKKRKTTED